jgi:hypothetical protein
VGLGPRWRPRKSSASRSDACYTQRVHATQPPLHQLRHGQEEAALKEIAGLKAPRGEAGEVVRKEKNYFAGQKKWSH